MGILDIAREDGLEPKKVAATKGGEYHSPCPACGGKDRFIIWDKLNRYMCRQCNKKGDEIQYYKDFRGLSYVEACQKIGNELRDNPFVKRGSLQEERLASCFEPRIAKMPSLKWRLAAVSFSQYCYEQLKKTRFALDLFQKRGFSEQTIDQFHLGWNPNTLWLERERWGIGSEGKKLWIPKGLLIPTYDCTTRELVKLKIRRSDWYDGDTLPKYVEISGSMQTPSVYGGAEGKPVFVVESELDAILLQQCAGDLCCSMALGGASKRPDAVAHQLLVNAPAIVFSLDVDHAGALAYRWWRREYPRMKLCPPPIGKSPGDAFLKGIDLKVWIGFVLS